MGANEEQGSIFSGAFKVWIVMFILAIVGGTLRQGMMIRIMSPLTAEVVEGGILIVIYYWIIVRFVKSHSEQVEESTGWMLGLMWCTLTIIFETVFFRFAIGHSWDELLADYRIDQGRMWLVVLLSLFVSPWLAVNAVKK